ncbi:MAG: hypothetical protein FDZ75_04540 [Actinobacteria bacterium]|nr:MAG: hypothetical protein FDZ75_04540 [Actinomycetota bacterium]
MPEKSHWPFGADPSARVRYGERSHEIENERARLAAQTAMRFNQRHDRLLVGGRAHTKKRGLS